MASLKSLYLVLCMLAASLLFSQAEALIMVTEAWPPYRMDDPASPSGFSGIDIDLILALEARLSRKIEIQRVPWARALDMMRQGQADLITGIAWTAERSDYMLYAPTSYSAVHPRFFTQKGKAGTVRSYADLKGKSIGQSTHSAYFEPYNSDTGLDKVNLSTEIQILQLLAIGRIDLAIGTEPNLSWDIARLGYKEVLEPTSWQPSSNTPLFVAVSKKSEALALVDKIDTAIKAMQADGSLQAILDKYR